MSSIGSFERLSNEEVDPVADFITREQNMLAELDDQSIVGNPFSSNISSHSASPMEHVEANMSDALFDPFGMQQANPVPLETNDLFATNTDSTPVNNQSIIDIVSDIDQNCTSDQTHPPSVDAESNQNDELFGMMAQAGESVVSTAIELSQTDESEVTMIETNHQVVTKENDDRSTPEPIEPATMSRWREVQRERLQQKDAQESAANGLLREKAESELQDWYDTYQRTLEKRKQDNREAQETFEQERDSTKPGQDWVKVASYCDFVNKSAQGRDLTRMRTILLKQKQLATTGSVQPLQSES